MERNRSQSGRTGRRARFGREAKEEAGADAGAADAATKGAWAGAGAGAWETGKSGAGTRIGVRAAAKAGAGIGAPKRDWVPLIAAATTRAVPLGFVFYLLATTLYLFYWGQPLGATEMWARALLWNVWPWLGLMCLALTWAWASRKDPRQTWLRRLMNRAPLFGKKAAILGAALGSIFLLQAAVNDVELALDLQAGPQGETGVVCTEFKEWPSYKNGDAKTTFVLRHAGRSSGCVPRRSPSPFGGGQERESSPTSNDGPRRRSPVLRCARTRRRAKPEAHTINTNQPSHEFRIADELGIAHQKHLGAI